MNDFGELVLMSVYLSKAEMSVGGREINFNLCEAAPIYAGRH
jgi:hypothetical protein